MRADKIVISVFMALALLVLLVIFIFSGLKTTHFNIRLNRSQAPDRSAEIAAASRARVDEMRAEAWVQMSQAYAQSVMTESRARAEATLKQASADAMQTRSMALLPWMGLLLVALVILVMLFRRQPIPVAQEKIVLLLPPGTDRGYVREALRELEPGQIRQLPRPVNDNGAIVVRSK